MPHACFLHERFLFRHGHDRTMLLHGRELVRRGWSVSFVAFAADRHVIEAIGGRAVLLPPGAPAYETLDTYACDLLAEHWFAIFPEGGPDVVVNGGWPFYAFNARAEALGAASVVFDAGATPLDGAPPSQIPVQMKLRALRRAHMPEARRSVAVSGFISASQTRANAPYVHNTVVLNGVDHIDEPLWSGQGGETSMQGLIETLRSEGRRLLMHLGRWECGYKNRDGALTVLRRVREHHDAALVVLAPNDPELPEDIKPHVIFAGFPNDSGLRSLMLGVDAGVSASLWEGFNLPLAEMHYLGQPAYALALGAHCEASIDPAYLHLTLDDLADAIGAEFAGQGPRIASGTLNAYRTRFTWSRAAGELEFVLRSALTEKRGATPVRLLAMDVTNASRDPSNSGVVRVTRQLARALQPYVRLLLLTWDDASVGYRTLSSEERAQLGAFGGPHALDEVAPAPLGHSLAAQGSTLAHLAWLAPETGLQARGGAVANWFAAESLEYVAVLHDLIPLTHAGFCAPEIVIGFKAYAHFLSCATRLLANSQTTADAWRRCMGGDGPGVLVETLPGDFGVRGEPKAAGGADLIRILTVSTFEPRKNHASLVTAFARAKALMADRKLELHLVGAGYEGGEGVYDLVCAAAAADPDIKLHGRVDDIELGRLYAESDFTVYPSVWEGFGLPIVESIHRATPFVCSSEGSMGELALCGAGLTCDVEDVDALAAAIVLLATDDRLRHRLSRVAALTPTRTWDDYARACLAHAFDGRPEPDAAVPRPRTAPPLRQLNTPGNDMNWESLLYPGKPIGAWQMSDSERMALTGLLARRRPKTYLEIGTYFGGSALLASEFADWVVTIDIDPEAGDRFERPDNVTFLVGHSHEVLPGLLDDLLAKDLYPEFVLIDGDHSAEGVCRDMEFFLKIRPPHPVVVVFHDSFNPVCRQGIRTAPWGDCPYVARLDIDFVPGRLVDTAGDPFFGQMWGGLAVAILTPEPQAHPHLLASSETLFRRTLSESMHVA